jgi:PST family polysaccharide transporter
VLLALGNQWLGAAPVFQILVISALGQLLLEPAIWLLVSRGQAGRLLKLLLSTCPAIVLSFLIGLPFGISGVALSGSVVLLAIFPLLLKFTFRGTELTLRRLAQAIVRPISLALAGTIVGKLALYVMAPTRPGPEFLIAATAFAAIILIALVLPCVREEILFLQELFSSGICPGTSSSRKMTAPPHTDSPLQYGDEIAQPQP